MKNLLKITAQRLNSKGFRGDMMDDDIAEFEPFLPIPKTEAARLNIKGVSPSAKRFREKAAFHGDKPLKPGRADPSLTMVRARDYAAVGGKRKFLPAFITDDADTPYADFQTYLPEGSVSKKILGGKPAEFTSYMGNALPGQKKNTGLAIGDEWSNKITPMGAKDIWMRHVDNQIDRFSHRHSNAGGEGFLPPNFALTYSRPAVKKPTAAKKPRISAPTRARKPRKNTAKR